MVWGSLRSIFANVNIELYCTIGVLKEIIYSTVSNPQIHEHCMDTFLMVFFFLQKNESHISAKYSNYWNELQLELSQTLNLNTCTLYGHVSHNLWKCKTLHFHIIIENELR